MENSIFSEFGQTRIQMIQKSVARNAEVLLNLGPWKLFSLACGVEGSKLVAA